MIVIIIYAFVIMMLSHFFCKKKKTIIYIYILGASVSKYLERLEEIKKGDLIMKHLVLGF